MIVQLREPLTEKTDDYAYVCDPEKRYFVYATLTDADDNNESYMINVWGKDSNNTIYEIPSHYFTIVDSATPGGWEQDSYEAYGKKVKINSFPEMAHDKFFYDKLLSDDPKTVDIFERYQKEYEDEASSFTAQ